MQKKFIVVTVVSLVVVAGAAAFILRPRPVAPGTGATSGTTSNTGKTTQTVTLEDGSKAEIPNIRAERSTGASELNAPRSEVAPVTVSVNITDDGFSPQAVYIAAKATVTWKNIGSKPHQVRITTNPYDPDQLFKDMVSPRLQPGETYSYTFDNSNGAVASVGYYDGLEPSHKGSVAFEQQ